MPNVITNKHESATPQPVEAVLDSMGECGFSGTGQSGEPNGGGAALVQSLAPASSNGRMAPNGIRRMDAHFLDSI